MLFHVAQYGLTAESKEFEAKFRDIGDKDGSGSSDDCPIVLDSSVSSQDFTLFLQALYHTSVLHVDQTSFFFGTNQSSHIVLAHRG